MTKKMKTSALIEAVRADDIKLVKRLLNNGVDVEVKDDGWTALMLVASIENSTEIAKLLIDNGADIEATNDTGWTALMLASFINSKELVKLLIDSGANIDAKGNNGWTALMWVSYENSKDVAKLLIDSGADIDAKNDDGETALMRASFKNSKDVAKLLIDSGADIDAKNDDGETALMWASFKNSKDIAKLLIDSGADIEATNDEGWTALMWASEKNSIDIAKLLIDSGADIDVKHIIGGTALMLASLYNSIEIAKLLIDNGADIAVKDDMKMTTLEYSCINDNKDIAKLLIDSGADIEAKDDDGETALMWASFKNSKDIAKLLIDSGADINAKDNDGRTTLMWASRKNSIDVAKLLIDNGADIEATNDNGWTALMWASFINSKELAKLLIDSGADINAKDDGWTALIGSSIGNSTDVAKLLIDSGADIDAKYDNNWTALVWASIYNNADMAKLLIDNGVNIKAEDDKGFCAIDYADSGSIIKKLLIQKGAKPKSLTEDEKKHLEELKSNSSNESTLNKMIDNLYSIKDKIHPKLFEVIHEDNIYEMINSHDNEKYLPSLLLESIKRGETKMIEEIVKKGIDLDYVDKKGKSAWDYAVESKESDTIIDILNRQNELIKESYNPMQLVELLTNFTKDTPIKYTTHLWDFGSIKSEYGGFDGFMQKVRTQFDEISEDLKELSLNLHKKIELFLLKSEIEESWSKKADLKIGWKTIDGLKEWCDEGKNPFEFKLKSTLQIEGEKIRLFRDVIELFKKEIEIRNENNHLESIFLKQQKRLGKEFEVELVKLKGRGFYTDVEKFENSIERIFDAMKMREEHKKITVMVEEPTDDTIEIIITQHGSTSNKKSYELLEAVDGGDFKILKDNLTNLCYWSIEDSYEGEGFVVDVFNQDIETIPDIPSGFTHKLRFYKK